MPSILFVLSSATTWTLLDGTEHPTGFWAGEFVEPYQIFTAAGWDSTVATPLGQTPVVDPLSFSIQSGVLPRQAQRFRAQLAQLQPVLAQPRNLHEITAADFCAFDVVFYPGGHAPMQDLAVDTTNAALLQQRISAQLPTALLCHGPAALLATTQLSEPSAVAGRTLTALSNLEERCNSFAKQAPWFLEDRLRDLPTKYSKSWIPFFPHIVVDGCLYTGQNPQSARRLAQRLLRDHAAASAATGC